MKPQKKSCIRSVFTSFVEEKTLKKKLNYFLKYCLKYPLFSPIDLAPATFNPQRMPSSPFCVHWSCSYAHIQILSLISYPFTPHLPS